MVRLEQKGRGRALHAVWSASDAPVLAYMDVDLSTDLAALAPLVAPLISGHSDLAIGTRLGRGARVVRGAKREIISRCYNLILKSTLAARFSDAQCGFKAIRADVAARLLPHVADTGWFFDTELLVLAERSGLRIHEVPVDWVDDPDSRVDIVATATADLKGIGRLLRGFADGSIPVNTIAAQLGSSRRVGRTGIAAAPGGPVRRDRRRRRPPPTCVLFMLMQGWAGAQAANLIALLLTAIGNTAANRRFTFGVGGRTKAAPPPHRGSDGVRRSRWRSPAARSPCCTPSSPSRTTWSSSPCWCWPTWWPPPCASSCCAAGCFTRADPADCH